RAARPRVAAGRRRPGQGLPRRAGGRAHPRRRLRRAEHDRRPALHADQPPHRAGRRAVSAAGQTLAALGGRRGLPLPRAGWLAWTGVAIIAGLVLVAVLGPLVVGDPNALDLDHLLAGPSAAHPFGTDQAGRNILARVVYGARTSLLGPLGIVVLS